MKNIIFIAPPAAGKGTQSDLLVNKYGYMHISTGDLLREEVASKTELGIEIDDIIKSGALVSNEIVTKLLKNALNKSDNAFILDGYPRNIEQAHILEEILLDLNKQIDLVIYLEVSEDVATKRATGRLSCLNCNKTYHKYFAKPIKENICDVCGNTLTSRSDDTEETFKVRYENYIKNTSPLLDYYQNKGLLYKISANNDADETFMEIMKVLK